VRAVPKTVPISTRALLQRINRRLAADGEVLKAARTAKVASSVGHYFVVRGNRIARERTGVNSNDGYRIGLSRFARAMTEHGSTLEPTV
jgi:hypothetical protein